MKILYLLNSRQESFTLFSKNPVTNFPWVDSLIDELQKSNLLSLAIAVPINSKDFQTAKKNGITLYGLPARNKTGIFKKALRRFRKSSDNSEVNRHALQAISEFRPDVIHIFGTESSLGLIISKQNVPVVIHFQGSLQVILKKWFSGISKWEQFRYASLKDILLSHGSFHEFQAFKKRAEREALIMNNCKYYVGRTDFDRRLVSLVSPNAKYFHCEEFIRKVFFEKSWDYPLSDDISCVSILKGTTYKGIDLLVETALILGLHSPLNFNFKIIGLDEKDEVLQLVKRKYRHEFKYLNISYLGRMDADKLALNLCNSNFYIHPSYIENSPNSVCEAMALGIPIISTNVGGISSLISDKKEGILVQEGEPFAMAAAILELSRNYQYARLLGKNARKRSVQRHAPSEITKQLLNTYKSILQENE